MTSNGTAVDVYICLCVLLSTATVCVSLIKSQSVQGGKPQGAVILIGTGPHPAAHCSPPSSSGPKHTERT